MKFDEKTGRFIEEQSKTVIEVIHGKDGRDGKNGKDGIDGKDGRDGIDGKDGIQGPMGPQGLIGPQGPAGKDGVDGLDGANGKNGVSLEYKWDDTKLGIKREDELSYSFVDLRGPIGIGSSGGGTRKVKDLRDATITNVTDGQALVWSDSAQAWINAIGSGITAGTITSGNDSGAAGTVHYDNDNLYVCIATNTWKYIPLTAFPASSSLLMEDGSHLLLETGDKILLEV